MQLIPISLKKANEWVEEHHRHHKRSQGHKFSIAAEKDGVLVGVCIVGRPVSRMLDNGKTAEVVRLCTTGEKNVCSFLYAAAARASKAMGYKRIGTYILSEEPGTSLVASGWTFSHKSGGGSWSRSSRLREDKHPMSEKSYWFKDL